MIAAKSMFTVKPAGKKVEAINHEKLLEVLKKYNRYNP